MLSTTILTGLLGASFALAAPLLPRVTIDKAATAEAQQRDDTATRAITASEIKTSDGRCLSVDPEGGDFRQNLIPIQALPCSGNDNQKWDFITAGKHNNQPGNALIVNSQTNGCLNFDPRRAAGNQVILFSCGGRADGEGETTDSQLFPFTGNPTALVLTPKNSQGKVCFTVKGDLLDQSACDAKAPSQDQLFNIGDANGAAQGGTDETTSAAQATDDAFTTSSTQAAASATQATQGTGSTTISASKPTGTAKLDQKATEEAQRRDDTATRAFTSVQVKTSGGQCLNVDPLAGDFRQNLIPVTVGACDGSAGQKFDVITEGKHNNVDGTALIVSSLTNGCLNFDDRRAPGNQVLLFSCGGRADGDGQVTDSQLFKFDGGNTASIALSPQNAKTSCMINKNGLLDITQCDNTQDQLFSFVA
ncbi:hypothetical protein E1B28_009021 [Marasmius oreades]|uniref:Ricin B lectin domain-containing protein n=1 Tax=Marasmius oreades TaxID=181124 RepID=A0A9P7USQ2_9AGAR|nr:uncharacterized protein E1B28_009021 [Marasmius oreades]KAG7092688.1 hypothetical protein E1B28_009021 [Marasmius oreades]